MIVNIVAAVVIYLIVAGSLAVLVAKILKARREGDEW